MKIKTVKFNDDVVTIIKEDAFTYHLELDEDHVVIGSKPDIEDRIFHEFGVDYAIDF